MIYVDPMAVCVPNRRWKYNQSCHLFADNVSELYDFAKTLGLKRSWFQGVGRLPHYDLTTNMRKKAVANGAIEVSFKFLADRLKFMRGKTS